MPWCVPWHVLVSSTTSHGLPRHALECAMGGATACLGVCHGSLGGGMPCSVPRLVMACLGTCHDMPRCVPRLALMCAIPWLDVRHGMPRHVPRHAHEQFKPRLVACPSAAHGMPSCVPRLAMACPWARPTEVSRLPMGCHGFPRHALVCAMARPWGAKASHGLPRHALVCGMASPWGAKACHGVCHDKSCACQIDFCPCKPPKLCFLIHYMTLGMCPMLHLPLTTHFLFFMNFPIFSIKKIKKKNIFFQKT
jgi:hypothetical protein